MKEVAEDIPFMSGREKCAWCRYFDRYYTRGVKQFNKTELGFCHFKNTETGARDGCENFAPAQKDKRSERLLKHCLNDLLTEISEIRKVIESEDDGDNTE